MIYYHYAELVHRQAEKYGSRTALKYRDNATGKWLKISWKEFSEKVMLTAKAMAEFGIISGFIHRICRNAFIRILGHMRTVWFLFRCMQRILRGRLSI